jgi:hypothetical protein
MIIPQDIPIWTVSIPEAFLVIAYPWVIPSHCLILRHSESLPIPEAFRVIAYFWGISSHCLFLRHFESLPIPEAFRVIAYSWGIPSHCLFLEVFRVISYSWKWTSLPYGMTTVIFNQSIQMMTSDSGFKKLARTYTCNSVIYIDGRKLFEDFFFAERVGGRYMYMKKRSVN